MHGAVSESSRVARHFQLSCFTQARQGCESRTGIRCVAEGAMRPYDARPTRCPASDVLPSTHPVSPRGACCRQSMILHYVSQRLRMRTRMYCGRKLARSPGNMCRTVVRGGQAMQCFSALRGVPQLRTSAGRPPAGSRPVDRHYGEFAFTRASVLWIPPPRCRLTLRYAPSYAYRRMTCARCVPYCRPFLRQY
ncbi:hypothetical protein OH76DRAFT_281336 [Lentinus brumalis]|uniref:Uncharacterized protein n=1 Tax=Lentinus brumalis TaxID=2498619 RepID=A0A371CKS0_9APHY|nr:hypothetical protein OH76DRAFT_281336 [Polyporus brumalis]